MVVPDLGNPVIKTWSFIIVFFFSLKFFKDDKKSSLEKETIIEDIDTTTNIIKDVSYRSKDAEGNEYILNADEGQIDLTNNNVIFLTNVKAIINMVSGEIIDIRSDYGKYNINNYDTIFSKNVLINYLDNKIKGEYLDFSINRSTMIMSKEIVYSNLSDTIEADVIEINIKNKDTKIFMYNKKNKVSIKKKN